MFGGCCLLSDNIGNKCSNMACRKLAGGEHVRAWEVAVAR
jgi:hypothetical protein